MSGHPQAGHYDDGHGPPGQQQPYYDDDQPYYDNYDYPQHAAGAPVAAGQDAYYDDQYYGQEGYAGGQEGYYEPQNQSGYQGDEYYDGQYYDQGAPGTGAGYSQPG